MPTTKLCWVSCVFITLLSNEARPGAQNSDLRDAVDAVDRGLAHLVTSTLVETELLDIIDHAEQRRRFDDLMNMRHVLRQPVTAGIARLAGDIRYSLKKEEVNLKSMDAIFVATAITQECDSLQTYDGQLVKLSERDEIRNLKITTPRFEQRALPLEG